MKWKNESEQTEFPVTLTYLRVSTITVNSIYVNRYTGTKLVVPKTFIIPSDNWWHTFFQCWRNLQFLNISFSVTNQLSCYKLIDTHIQRPTAYARCWLLPTQVGGRCPTLKWVVFRQITTTRVTLLFIYTNSIVHRVISWATFTWCSQDCGKIVQHKKPNWASLEVVSQKTHLVTLEKSLSHKNLRSAYDFSDS